MTAIVAISPVGSSAQVGRPRSCAALRDCEALSKAANSGKVASEPGPIRRIAVRLCTS
jgi:hypothetical protein